MWNNWILSYQLLPAFLIHITTRVQVELDVKFDIITYPSSLKLEVNTIKFYVCLQRRGRGALVDRDVEQIIRDRDLVDREVEKMTARKSTCWSLTVLQHPGLHVRFPSPTAASRRPTRAPVVGIRLASQLLLPSIRSWSWPAGLPGTTTLYRCRSRYLCTHIIY